MNDVSDLLTPELIIEHNIDQVVFLPSRGDTIISKYRIDGQIEIEYLIDKEGKDTSIVFYGYDNDILKKKLHINLTRNDTVTYTTYEYENSKLKTEICINPAIKWLQKSDLIEIDRYIYGEKGNLKKVESTTTTRGKVIRNGIKEYDKSGRLIKEIEIKNQEENIINYENQKNKIIIKNTEGNEIIQFNERGFPISASTEK